jgi:hypothetical protein
MKVDIAGKMGASTRKGLAPFPLGRWYNVHSLHRESPVRWSEVTPRQRGRSLLA